jgi:hypothetical protein
LSLFHHSDCKKEKEWTFQSNIVLFLKSTNCLRWHVPVGKFHPPDPSVLPSSGWSCSNKSICQPVEVMFHRTQMYILYQIVSITQQSGYASSELCNVTEKEA